MSPPIKCCSSTPCFRVPNHFTPCYVIALKDGGLLMFVMEHSCCLSLFHEQFALCHWMVMSASFGLIVIICNNDLVLHQYVHNIYIYIIPPAKQGWCAHLWTTSGIGVFRSTYSHAAGSSKADYRCMACVSKHWRLNITLTYLPPQAIGRSFGRILWWFLVISCDFWCILAGQIDLAAFCSNLSGRSVALTEMGRARGQLLDHPWCVLVPWCFPPQFFSRSMGSLCGFQ